ncbi:MAG TPA: Arm DNA-binding domain-containing protein [Rhizobiaceae bacterium]|nr:Arm DNA-binding domain-containing protein [Rhizobiaceae bacterium]
MLPSGGVAAHGSRQDHQAHRRCLEGSQRRVCPLGELTGFGIRVRPSGSKSFVAVYRTGGRNAVLRKVTIGAVGKIEADAAREQLQASRRIVTHRRNPPDSPFKEKLPAVDKLPVQQRGTA